MVSQYLFTAFIGLTALERVYELIVSRRNARWSMEQGGQEFGRGHFPFMVVLHTSLLVGVVAEVWLLGRVFEGFIGWPMLVIAVACQGLRWWIIKTLGNQWNTRVIVVPGLGRVEGGPYRYLDHPNYVVVITEGIALPLIHGAWITATVFTLLNIPLLMRRVQIENRALASLTRAQ